MSSRPVLRDSSASSAIPVLGAEFERLMVEDIGAKRPQTSATRIETKRRGCPNGDCGHCEGCEESLADRMGGLRVTRSGNTSKGHDATTPRRVTRSTAPATVDPLVGKAVWYEHEGNYYKGAVLSKHSNVLDPQVQWYKIVSADGKTSKNLSAAQQLDQQPPKDTCPPNAWGKLKRTDLTEDGNIKSCEVDFQENLNRWTPSPEERESFFNSRFAGGRYTATVPGADGGTVKVTLTGAFVRDKHVVFKYRDADGVESGIDPARLLFPESKIHGRKLPIPVIAAEPWADERSAFFANLTKKAFRNGQNCVVLDGRGRNTTALRKTGIPKTSIFNVDMDAELACWQRLHGMNSVYSNAYLVKKGDPGLIENSILFQSRHPFLKQLYQNTVAAYFDYYGCKHKLFDDVMNQSDTLLPKAKVIGIAQFTQMAACRRIVQEPLAIDAMPQWKCVFDKTQRSMRCRFYVKKR